MSIIFVCPECEGKKVLVASIQKWEINSGDFYCHSIKTHDSYAPVNCQDCDWTGERHELLQVNTKGNKQ